ncbi:MAG: VOC family protein [Deltaproteobacteria bacterium]|nr:VOC family protein [Deltaproteobacteria bacterium]
MIHKLSSEVKELLSIPEISQVGIVVRDLNRSLEAYREFFRVGPFTVFEPEYTDKMYRGKPEDFKMRLAIAPWGPVDLELIQPLQGKTIYDELLAARGEGLHHIGCVIQNLSGRIEIFQTLGLQVLQSGRREGASWAYMDTEPLAGIVIELIERHKV